MKKIVLLFVVVLSTFNLKSQIYVGFNFNVVNSYLQTKVDEHFSVPYGLNLGYNSSKNVSFVLSAFSDKYILGSGEENIYYQFPISISKKIYSESLNYYYKIGFIYSSSIIQNRLNENSNYKNYFVSGPGFLLSAGLDFKRYQIEVGALNVFEMFGSGRKRQQSIFFISSNIYIFKK